jgi:L-asparaginase II
MNKSKQDEIKFTISEEIENPEIPPIKMVYVYRGDSVESIHRGSAVVCDSAGNIKFQVGNPDFVTYNRSAAKPFQVIPLVESGAYRKFGFTSKELAVMAGSHSGEEDHVQTVAGILNKIGLSEINLKCGVHIPHYFKVKNMTPRPSDTFTQIHNNCSGKHASMLAVCVFKSWPVENYLDFDHPCQKMILKSLADACGFPAEKIGRGIDGCGAPVFALPLINMARGMAQLLSPNTVPREIAKVYSTIILAMREHPNMVSGKGRFDYSLSKATRGRIVSKSGAEGLQLFGIPDKRLGGVVKIEDGSQRAIYPATIEFLRLSGFIQDSEISELDMYAHPVVRDHSNKIVGKLRCKFSLKEDK